MCGVCGIYHFDKKRDVQKESLKNMTDSMQHRGPDGEGFYLDGNFGLGHRRLSIIDLSDNGQQPMKSGDDRYWIVLNGEIYNYLELRQELISKGYTFRSYTDTEVLLNLYKEEGKECVHALNGMFAFAIWDRKARTLFAARDRLGIKPFYYIHNKCSFAFSSEIKALFQIGLLKPELNSDALTDYLTFQLTLGKKTLFNHVHKLLPAHTLLIKPDGTLKRERYWDIDFTIDTEHTEEYFHSRLLRLLEDAVRLRLRADVPVGAHLSGGLDSSTMASQAAALLGSRISTFSGGFREGPQYDETPYARMVAERINSKHREIFPSAQDFVDSMPKLIYHMDVPAAGPGVFPQYYVSKLASQHVKVVLGGQGGDEVFGGYARYLIAYLEACIRGGIEGTQEDEKYVVDFSSILPNLPQLKGYEPLMRYFFQDGLFDTPDKRYFRLIDRSRGVKNLVADDALTGSNGYDSFQTFAKLFNAEDCKSYINRMTRFDLMTLLPALLHVEDRTSMASSLESRVPLLDHRIIELAASMPPMIKYKGGRSKHIFREVVKHIVPMEIYNREDKMGFPVPLSDWYQKGPVREFVRETLLGTRARNRGLLQTKNIGPLLDSERAYGRGIWGLLSLELWMQTFIDD